MLGRAYGIIREFQGTLMRGGKPVGEFTLKLTIKDARTRSVLISIENLDVKQRSRGD